MQQAPRRCRGTPGRNPPGSGPPGGHNVRVFGSTLHGDPGPDSDIDYLIDLDPDRNLLDLGGLQMDLQELLERPVDLKTEGFLRRDIRERVLEAAVEL